MFWIKYKTELHILLLSVFLLCTRLAYLDSPAGRIGDADEAVFGIMAQKIQAFEEFPIYCWGAHYAGAPVSYIAAIIFHFADSSFLSLRLAMLLPALCSMICFYFVYRKMFGASPAFFGVLFLIFCPFMVLSYTMGAFGGYGESMLGIALIILLSWKIQQSSPSRSLSRQFFILGLVCGFFLYILFLVAPAIAAFALPTLFLQKKNRIVHWVLFILGTACGLLPFIVYNLQNHGATFVRSLGRSFSAGSEVMAYSRLNIIRHCIEAKILFTADWIKELPYIAGEYVLPASCGRWALLITGLLLAVILIQFAILVIRNGRIERGFGFRSQFLAFLVCLIVFTWIGNLSRPRHMMPLLVVIPVVLSVLAEKYTRWRNVLIGTLCVCGLFQAINWRDHFRQSRFDPAPVAGVMNRQGINEFYGSYWTTYPIIFASGGRILGAPSLLPYHETYSDRRPDYTQRTWHSLSPAFVFAQPESGLMDEFLKFLNDNEITCESVRVEGAIVYFHLSRSVRAVPGKNNRTTFLLNPS